MAIGLPVNLGAVADAADRRGGAGRFALDAVYVELKQADRLVYPPAGQEGPPDMVTDRTYTVAATDTKRLVLVEGECGNPDDVPGLEAVRTAPNGGTKGLIPLKVFKKTFADAAKATGRQQPAARQVLVALSEVQATLGYCDFETQQVQATPLVAGKFPPARDFIASTRKKKVAAKFAIDPKMFAEVLKTLASFCDGESMRVEVEVRGESEPLILTAANATQKVTGLVMPLSG